MYIYINLIFYVTFSHQSKGSDLSKTILKKLLPFDDLPEHSPLTNSASTLTPTPSMLYPQIQNSPDLLLQIPTHPQIQNSIS